MKRLVWGHATFFVLALCTAIWAWLGPHGTTAEEITLWNLPLSDLQAVHYEWPDGRTELTPIPARPGSGFQVRHWAKGALPEAGAILAADGTMVSDAGAAMEQATNDSTTTTFPAGKVALRALDHLFPLRVGPGLGQPDASRLEAMGLNPPLRSLELFGASNHLQVELGAETYGKRGRYARLSGRPEVYVLPAGAWRGLEGSALRLMEPKLLHMNVEDVLAVTLERGNQKIAWQHLQREDGAKRYFALPDLESEPLEEVASLVSMLRNLRAQSYVAPPDPHELEPIAAFSFRQVSGENEDLAFYRDTRRGRVAVQTKGWWALITQASADRLTSSLAKIAP